MAHVSVWQCDRCGFEERNQAGDRWQVLRVELERELVPDDLDDDDRTVIGENWDLCLECRRDLRRMLASEHVSVENHPDVLRAMTLVVSPHVYRQSWFYLGDWFRAGAKGKGGAM